MLTLCNHTYEQNRPNALLLLYHILVTCAYAIQYILIVTGDDLMWQYKEYSRKAVIDYDVLQQPTNFNLMVVCMRI